MPFGLPHSSQFEGNKRRWFLPLFQNFIRLPFCAIGNEGIWNDHFVHTKQYRCIVIVASNKQNKWKNMCAHLGRNRWGRKVRKLVTCLRISSLLFASNISSCGSYYRIFGRYLSNRADWQTNTHSIFNEIECPHPVAIWTTRIWSEPTLSIGCHTALHRWWRCWWW